MSTEPQPTNAKKIPPLADPECARVLRPEPAPSRIVPLLSIPPGTPWPDLTDDGKTVVTRYADKQQRLLVGPLRGGWKDAPPLLALINVGLFYQPKEPPLVPNVMLAVGVGPPRDFSKKENLAYFLWVIGKPPDVVVEILCDEDTSRMLDYAQVGVPYHVLIDPEQLRGGAVLQVRELVDGVYRQIDPGWLPKVGLGLCEWQGEYECSNWRWVRWCDTQGVVIPTDHERLVATKQATEEARRRADEAKHRADEIRRVTEEMACQRRAAELARAESLVENPRVLGRNAEA